MVNPSNGAAKAGTAELTQSGSGAYKMGLGEGLEYSGDGSGAGNGNYGNGWVNPHQPRLYFDGGDVLMESGPVETVRFVKTGTEYTAQYFVRDKLSYDSAGGKYTVTSPDGRRKIFSRFGVLEKMKDAKGNETVLTYGAGGELEKMETGSGSGAVGYYYEFDSFGRMESVVMRVGGTTASSDYRRVSYIYTAEGDLEKVVMDEKKGSLWEEIETAYYRYYTTGSRKLRFVLGDHAYEQMKSVNAAWPETASDGVLAGYADAEYGYDSKGRVSVMKTNGGLYSYQLSYATSAHSGSTSNVWTSKTVVQMPDGSTRTFYFNRSLNLLLEKVSEPQAVGAAKVWYPVCQRFDGNARIVLSASSEAVNVVDEADPTLCTLKPSSGVIEVYEYDANGNKTLEGLRKGATGALVLEKVYTFEARAVLGQSIYVTKTVTEYREATDTSASGPVTTIFDYTWYAGTFQIESVTTTLPAVPGGENGDGQTGVVVSKYDEYGFVVETVDAVGMKSTFEYYVDKGALKRSVEDAGTGRLNLTTDYEVDPLGRTVRTLGPEHTISLDGVATAIRRAQWTQYLDSKDEVRSISGYVKVSDSSEHAINPVQISCHYVDDPEVEGGRMEESIAAVYEDSGVPPKSHEFEQSDYVRWSTQHYDRNNQQTHSRLYHLIPASGSGTNGANYAQTEYGYDNAGRQNRTTSPEGTISLVKYNAMSWTMQSSTGTTEANLVTVSVNEYDDGVAGGNGNLTKTISLVDGSTANDRVVQYRYDWRNRQIETEANDGTRIVLSQRVYDNRGNVTKVDEYQTSISTGNLINRAESFFDVRNRQYRTKRYGVTVGTGTLQPALTSETYYDQAGRTVRSTPAGKVGFSVVEYDTAGRTKRQVRGYGGTLDLSNPSDISSAVIVEQGDFHYDNAGNSIWSASRQRFDNTTGNGALQNPTTAPKARVSYVANYPDALGRTVAVANYGTYGGAAWSRSATIPARSDDVLVSSSVFNAAGEQTESVDPMGTVMKSGFDQAGRQIKTIENYHAGTGSGPDINKTTRFEYNLDGNMVKLIAENPTTGDQVTEWIYGVTAAQGSLLNSKALVYQKVYPDSTGTTDRVTYIYNRQGQVTTMTDQAGTTHGYAYDKFGRVLEDAATFPGGSILDETVKKITRSYEVRGMLEAVSSIGSGTTVLNEVKLTYNAYGQLARDYQEHDGAVNSGTLFVAYSYADGSANTIRRTGVTYPDGTTTISTGYDGTAADALSRPDAIKEAGTTLCTYRYLGAGVFIGVKYDAASGVELTYEDGGTGDAGDQYTGLDRFGRLIETLWKKGADKQVHSKYGRNRFGGVVWRKDLAAHAQSVTTEDNYYTYDGLYQVKERQRGNLTGTPPSGITSLQQEEDWTYDATGNWQSYNNTAPTSAQARINNKANEITLLSSGAGDINPDYDPAGNMLTLPQAPGTGTAQYTLKWDAWNRLVEVKDGSTSVASYEYDGLTRRITKTNASETRHYYYNNQWRTVEERIPGATPVINRQYVWGLRDRWDLLRSKRSTGGGTLNETHYCLRDYLDPVAITGTDGIVAERTAYDAFGNVRFLASDYAVRTTSSFEWTFLFHAEFRDTDTKFYNYGYRYYDCGLGRWLSRDPIGEQGGVNIFEFVRNLSVNRRDKLGLSVFLFDQHTSEDENDALVFRKIQIQHLYNKAKALATLIFDLRASECTEECRHYYLHDRRNNQIEYLGSGQDGKTEMIKRISSDVMEYNIAGKDLFDDVASVKRSLGRHQYDYDLTLYNLHNSAENEIVFGEEGAESTGSGVFSPAQVSDELRKAIAKVGGFMPLWCGYESGVFIKRFFWYVPGILEMGETVESPCFGSVKPECIYTYKPSTAISDGF